MALFVDSYLLLKELSLTFNRWRWQSIAILYPSFSNYYLSFLFVFHLRHSEDDADFNIFILSLSFSHSLSLSYLLYELEEKLTNGAISRKYLET